MLPNIKDPSGFKFSTFDPLLAPGNVAVYDGDVNLSALSWRDTTGGNTINFFNAPTYNAAGLNGHGTILFDGINQYGNSTSPAINQPSTTYLVFKQTTWINSRVLIDDGINLQLGSLYQIIGTPRIAYTDIIDAISSTQLAINTWGIVTLINNGANSKLRINLLNAINGDLTINKNGITLAADQLGGSFSNCSFAYIIMRNVADPTWLQNNFINWLKNRFAI